MTAVNPTFISLPKAKRTLSKSVKGRSWLKIKFMMNLVVLTGAGVSAESGIPTFRGKEGLWKNFKPEELATPEAFRKIPNWFGSGMIGEDSL